MTILLLGRDEDLCCALVRECLVDAGKDIWFLPEDQLLPGLRLTWRPSGAEPDGLIAFKDRQVNFADIGAVLSRFYGIPVQPGEFETTDGRYVSAEWNALLMAWLSRMPCRVVNRLRPELWYKRHLNVPDLASLVPEMRFKQPRTLITTIIDEAHAFCESVGGAVRYSPLTHPARYRIETEDDRQRLSALEGTLPFHLTEWVAGRNLDAFVIGLRVVPADPGDDEDIEVPAAVQTQCAEIRTALDLDFFRLSLVNTASGDWYCFGLDRMPQLYGYSARTQMRIARGVARHLAPDGDGP